MKSEDKAELEAGLDAAARALLRKVEGTAMVSLIAREDGKVLFSSCGLGLVTQQQYALLEEAARVMIDLTMRVTAQAEVVSDRSGRFRKPEKVN